MNPVSAINVDPARIRAAWTGRISGCILGKPVEILSFQHGRRGLDAYLRAADSSPLRDYVPLLDGHDSDRIDSRCCRGHIVRAEADDDINYTLLALMVLEDKGAGFSTADVARSWLRRLPAGSTWTAERAAYRTLLEKMDDEFVNGAEPGFDLELCSDNPCNEWNGAQIRADLYGWVCPGRPALAADFARRDAALSHRGEGVHGATFIAALGAAIPTAQDLEAAIDAALEEIPGSSQTAVAVEFGRKLAGQAAAIDKLYKKYDGMSPVHTLNNLSLVVWALCSAHEDFSSAVGNAVAAGPA